MQRDSSTESIWQPLEAPVLPSRKIEKGESFDVAVVGAGITGVTTALLLQKAGKKCLLIEARTLGYGTTSGTTAHLNTIIDTPYYKLEKDFGNDVTRLVAAAVKEAIAIVRGLVEIYRIACDFEYVKGYVFSENAEETSELKKIAEAAQRAGITADYTEEMPLSIPFNRCLSFPGQARFHPMKYLYALATEFIKAGGVISERNRVTEVEERDNHCDLQTEKEAVRSRKVVYATHIPPGINLLHFYCAPYRSYVLGLQLSEEKQYPEGLVYDMKKFYHYFRTHRINGKRYLIAGGEDHKTGSAEDAEASFSTLETYVRTYFDVRSIDFKWSSQYYASADGLPYIGRLPGTTSSIYVATGFNGNGMIFGSLSGKILADIITKGSSPYEKLFNPKRVKPVAGFKNFVNETAGVIKHFIGDRITPIRLENLAELKSEEAKIVNYKDRKLAVYKSPDGEIKALNPVCPHAKCFVQWNNAETSWDCPCHGSRFSLEGEVLTGPAFSGLQVINEKRQ